MKNRVTITNFVKSFVYFSIIAVLSRIMIAGIFIYEVFPQVMYLFWLLFISLGFTLKWEDDKKLRLIAVSPPFLVNLSLIVYALLMSGGFPNRILEEKLLYWNGIHYLNLHILLSPIMLSGLMYYVRYILMLFLPSSLLWFGMRLSGLSKEHLEDTINAFNLKKRDR